MKKQIHLNEAELNRLIKESVKIVLKEGNDFYTMTTEEILQLIPTWKTRKLIDYYLGIDYQLMSDCDYFDLDQPKIWQAMQDELEKRGFSFPLNKIEQELDESKLNSATKKSIKKVLNEKTSLQSLRDTQEMTGKYWELYKDYSEMTEQFKEQIIQLCADYDFNNNITKQLNKAVDKAFFSIYKFLLIHINKIIMKYGEQPDMYYDLAHASKAQLEKYRRNGL